MRKYEKYLLDVVDNATDGEYDEIAEVVNRHNTLEGANVVRGSPLVGCGRLAPCASHRAWHTLTAAGLDATIQREQRQH